VKTAPKKVLPPKKSGGSQQVTVSAAGGFVVILTHYTLEQRLDPTQARAYAQGLLDAADRAATTGAKPPKKGGKP
jgi:hypothetical protein